MRGFLWVILAVLLAGCSDRDLDQAVRAKTEEALALLESEDRDPAALAELIRGDLKGEEELAACRRILSAFPHEPARQRLIIDWQASKVSRNVTNYYVAYRYGFDTTAMGVELWLTRDAPRATPRITGLNLVQLTNAMHDENALNFWDKSAIHYLVALWTVLAPAFAIGTVVACLRSPIGRRKRWWWAICLIGALPITFNWSTGFLQFGLFSITFIRIGLVQPHEYLPYILQSYVPLGAILFWIRRRKLIAGEAARLEALAKPAEEPVASPPS